MHLAALINARVRWNLGHPTPEDTLLDGLDEPDVVVLAGMIADARKGDDA